MRVAFVDKRPILEFLKVLEQRIAMNLQDETVICDMMNSLGLLKIAMEEAGDKSEVFPSHEIVVDSNRTSMSVTRDGTLTHDGTVVSDADIEELCSMLLIQLSTRAVEMVSELNAQSLRAILMLVSLLPLQADDCVNAIDCEVATRIVLHEATPHRNVDELLQSIALETINARRILFGDDLPKQSKTPLNGLKNGLKAMFGATSMPDNGDSEKEVDAAAMESSAISSDDLAASLKQALQSIEESALALQTAAFAAHTSFDRLIASPQREALLELGRCAELIEQYRRIDFVSGSRLSRLDQERRRDIAKRVLSRKLP